MVNPEGKTEEEYVAEIDAITASINDATREVGESERGIRIVLADMEEEAKLREANAAAAAVSDPVRPLAERPSNLYRAQAFQKQNRSNFFSVTAGALVGATIVAGFFYSTEPENMAEFMQEPAHTFQSAVDTFTQDNFGFTFK